MALEPLVLITGTLCDEQLWQPTLKLLRHPATVIVPGRDDVRAGEPSQTMAACAATFLDRLPERFALAGFSLGGLVALEMIAQEPERITRLALISAGARAETPDGAAARWAGFARARAEGFRTHLLEDLWPRCRTTNVRADNTLFPVLLKMAESVGLEVFYNQTQIAVTRLDSRPRLAAIASPLLLVGGAADGLCPPDRHEEIVMIKPDTVRVTVADCGHYVPLETPQLLAEYLESWLESS